jgi:dihydrolipoamide dehydrogenase
MDYDLIIIGAGPGGYVAAIRAGQMGLKTVLIEKAKMGGMCLNWGCIPTKALLESAKRMQLVKNAIEFGIDGIDPKQLSFNWKTAVKRTERIVRRLTKGVEYLLKKNGITTISGTATINADKTVSVGNTLLSAQNIIIATGSSPTPLSFAVPADMLVEVEQLLNLEEIPESVVIYGNGPHAVELAQFFAMAGKSSTLVTPEPVLVPQADTFLSDYAIKILKKSQVSVKLSAKISRCENSQVILESGETIPCRKLINASERKAVIPESAIDLGYKDGFIEVDDRLETAETGIFAIGDVNGRSIFAHAASAQGVYAVNLIKGLHPDSLFDSLKFPINIYTYPEMSQIGLNENQVEQLKNVYKLGEFPMTANGKALAEGETEGMVRVLSDKKYGEVLGVQIVGNHATDMIAEAALLIQMEGTVYDLAATIHAHPTVSEILVEAGLDAFDMAIHQ